MKSDRKTRKSYVSCICPRCRTKHVVYMFWTGRGTPRVYCPMCYQLFRKKNIVDATTEEHKATGWRNSNADVGSFNQKITD